MKVAIATSGRFHVLDLARELHHFGVDSRFYSYVPRKRAARFGLPAACQRGVLPLVAPLVAWQTYARGVMPRLQERATVYALNAAVMARLEPCDVFICMSGLYLEAARHARRRYGAQVWLERGSRHILSQRDIMQDAGAARGPSAFAVRRELAGYALADRIVVPSRQVVESFVERDPALLPKLFVNPYGVDLDQFPNFESAAAPAPGALKTILFVGGWSLRKGVDLLVEAVRRLDGVRLLHVGALNDAPFPSGDPRFEHVDPVPQWKLKDFYARAAVFALASREEGLALVQAQALASGLMLACTNRTGGVDLAHSPRLAARIFVSEPEVSAFTQALSDALASAARAGGAPQLLAADRDLLGWRAYGQRYFRELTRAAGV